jgi:hypothetical protein
MNMEWKFEYDGNEHDKADNWDSESCDGEED